MELVSGAEIKAFSFPAITREQLKLYSDVSGDFNPIHLDDEAARAAGLTGVIAHGMISCAMIAERAQRIMQDEASGGKAWVLKRFQTRFKAMVLPGDILTISGSVKQVTGDQIALDLIAKNQRGETTTTAIARYAPAQ